MFSSKIEEETKMSTLRWIQKQKSKLPDIFHLFEGHFAFVEFFDGTGFEGICKLAKDFAIFKQSIEGFNIS